MSTAPVVDFAVRPLPSKRHLRNATKLLLEVHALSKVSRQELCDHLGIQPTNLSNWNSFVECKIDGGAPSVETARRLLDFCAPYLLAKNSVLLTDVLKDAILISMILDRDDTPTEQILRGLTYNVDRELNKFRKLIVRHSAKLPNRLKKRYGPVGLAMHKAQDQSALHRDRLIKEVTDGMIRSGEIDNEIDAILKRSEIEGKAEQLEMERDALAEENERQWETQQIVEAVLDEIKDTYGLDDDQRAKLRPIIRDRVEKENLAVE
ncbi:protein of unknown function [Magnetospirillum sp. XM-1]|uniref:hypothetical protein n=1 Tax=Magnetospirillum sp. XM-1 TaxID=1663591 RepID=UPI00073DE4B5|nr:hypothetical protein [Magnetospirillum sp. XM-1]CUW40074.1 protein of unknown function [Magnetospirillum sp. XM-1]